MKRTTIPFAAAWIDLEIIILSEVSQTEKNKYMISLIHLVESKILIQMTLFTKQKQTHRHREQTCSGQGEGGVGEELIESFGLADANSYI